MKTNYPEHWCVQTQKDSDLATDQDLFFDLLGRVTGSIASGKANFYGILHKNFANNDLAWGTRLTLKEGIAVLQHLLTPESAEASVPVSKNEFQARQFMNLHFEHLTENFFEAGVDVLTTYLNELDKALLDLRVKHEQKAQNKSFPGPIIY